jgi:Kef-type K+ transport system membrane component KefB
VFDVTLIQTIGIVIVTGAAAVLVARQVQVPAIVAYLFAGLLLGPVLRVLDHAANGATAHGEGPLEVVAEIGIVLLLFLVGLELSLDKIRDVGMVALSAGIGQVVFTAAGGTMLALALGFSLVESIFLATALTFSSTVVVVKVLDQKGELNSLYGRIAVGIFLVQDMVVIFVLTILAGLGSAESMTIGSVAWGIGRAFVGMALLASLALIAARYLLPRPFTWVARAPQALLIWSLGWCFLFVGLADLMGLSREIGAFLAGLSLAQLNCSHDLRRRVHPLMSFFIAIFFVTLGAQMQFDAAVEHWPAAVGMSLFVLVGNPLIFMVIICRFGYSERTSFYTSVTVAQISEFSFVFAAVGMGAGLIDRSILSLIAVVGLVTFVASVYMILYNARLYEWLRDRGVLRVFGARTGDDAGESEDRSEGLRGHVIVVGMNSLGQLLAQRLHERGELVLAIDTDHRKLAELPCRTMIGDVDYLSVLHDAHLPKAKLAIVALKIEDVNRLFAYRCRRLGVPVAIHIFDRSVRKEAEALGPRYVIDSKVAADREIERLLAEMGVLPQ